MGNVVQYGGSDFEELFLAFSSFEMFYLNMALTVIICPYNSAPKS